MFPAEIDDISIQPNPATNSQIASFPGSKVVATQQFEGHIKTLWIAEDKKCRYTMDNGCLDSSESTEFCKVTLPSMALVDE